MKRSVTFGLILMIGMLYACQSSSVEEQKDSTATGEENPAAPGFNAQNSDPRAIAIADEVMKAMGGRQAWDQTRFLAWDFFGARQLLWDKFTGAVRIDAPRDSAVYLININDGTGKVWRKGEELSHPDSLAKYIDRGKSIWINDSYWLVMPYKLKDSGVTLKFRGVDTTEAGKTADVLQLTFEEVGKTPENKYYVFVDKDSRLVTQWQFFRQASDAEPGFTTPWQDYRNYGAILLSGDRGQRQLSDIRVLKEAPPNAFTSFDPVKYQ